MFEILDFVAEINSTTASSDARENISELPNATRYCVRRYSLSSISVEPGYGRATKMRLGDKESVIFLIVYWDLMV